MAGATVATKDFLAAIYAGGCEHEGADLIEFRLLGAGGKTEQIWLGVREALDNWPQVAAKLDNLNRKGFHIYYGVNLRVRQSGTAADLCPWRRVMWADLDYKDAALLAKNFAVLKGYNLLPSALNDTGNGYHAYWFLKEATDNPTAEKIMRQLARVLAGDHTYDGPRILRLPGTLNIKDPAHPKPCHTVRWNPERVYVTTDFDALDTAADGECPPGKKRPAAQAPRPAAPAAPVAETPPVYGNGHGFMHYMARTLAPYWQEGARHKLALGVAGLLRRDEVPQEVAAEILNKVSHMTGDPEPADRQKAVHTTYAADPAKLSTSTIIIEVLGDERAKAFLKAYNSVLEKCPPPPVNRAGLPEFNLYDCVPPGSLFDIWILNASNKTDAPLQYHAASILTLAAAALGNKVYVDDFHGKKLYPNLYTLLCGPSTRLRKSNSILMSKPLAKTAKIEVYPSNATVELLYSRLAPNPTDWADKNGNPCSQGDKGAHATAFYGNPSGIFYHSEFSHYLSASAKSYMQDSRNFFTDLYDGAPGGDTRETKTQGKYTIEDTAISMLCGVTLTSMKTFISKEDMGNGFLPRFLVIMPPRTHQNRYGRNRGKGNIDAYSEVMNQICALTAIQGPAEVTQEADGVFEKLDAELHRQMERYEGSEKEPLAAFLGRLSTMAFKIALIYGTATHHRPLVDGDAMRYAANLCQYSARGLEFFFEEVRPGERNPDLQYEEKVLRAARRAWQQGERPVSQLTIYRACHLTSAQVEAGIASACTKGVLIHAKGTGRGRRYIINEQESPMEG